ncbi:HAMP domain-containing histidine kinase [Alkaliphilus pronyensis]|uniref:histidine kinase n=1 Tax=Alkaliphilus pronyensis TaxID=1482732 RepID=A0A6I0F5B8_9FIRM|nr:HAMP domain-containing sensor histidine kinase [Alkaliphilus pronyensis]KAB3530678.1 HAMP domain-containing histidine kinase [Alkaliphilus pronyensis]
MSIRIRLILSYIGMIVIPGMLIIVLTVFSNSFFVGEDVRMLGANNPFQLQALYTLENKELWNKVNYQEVTQKEKLGDLKFIQSLDNGLEDIHAGIVWRKNGEVMYASSILDIKDLQSLLPAFKSTEKQEHISFRERKHFIYGQQDYYLQDQSENSLFFVINIERAKQRVNRWMRDFTLKVIGVLICTTSLLTFSMHRPIITSIKKLKEASKRIKEGELDYEIKPHLNDELGDLSNAFEDMRRNLKESFNVQKKYEENRKNLISNISHDLRTPIMSIKGHIEGIKDGIAGSPEKMDKYIHTIYKKACDMETLINELFLFSKLELKEVSFNLQPVDIVEYLKYCVEDLGLDIEKKGGKIQLNHHKEQLMVKVDIQQLQRVISNIIGNSIKYIGEKPLQIDVTVQDKGEVVVVEVRDNGKGISQEDLPYIFDRFYRADKSRNTSIGGSGLGLAISKQIIQKLGGTIWAESKLNEGTSIFFSLMKVEGGSNRYE